MLSKSTLAILTAASMALSACGNGSFKALKIDKRKLFTKPTQTTVEPSRNANLEAKEAVYKITDVKVGYSSSKKAVTVTSVIESSAGRETVALVGVLDGDGSAKLTDMRPLKDGTNRMIGSVSCQDPACKNAIVDLVINIDGHSITKQTVTGDLQQKGAIDMSHTDKSEWSEVDRELPDSAFDKEEAGEYVGAEIDLDELAKVMKRPKVPELSPGAADAEADLKKLIEGEDAATFEKAPAKKTEVPLAKPDAPAAKAGAPTNPPPAAKAPTQAAPPNRASLPRNAKATPPLTKTPPAPKSNPLKEAWDKLTKPKSKPAPAPKKSTGPEIVPPPPTGATETVPLQTPPGNPSTPARPSNPPPEPAPKSAPAPAPPAAPPAKPAEPPPAPARPEPPPVKSEPPAPAPDAKQEPGQIRSDDALPFPPAKVPSDLSGYTKTLAEKEIALSPHMNVREGGRARFAGNHGSLANASELPDSGVGFQHMETDNPHANFASGMLVSFLENAAYYFAKILFPGEIVYISDLSKKAGGKFGSHHQHQNGLDADIGYFGLDKPLRESAFVNSKGAVSEKLDHEKVWAFLKIAQKQKIFLKLKWQTALSRVFMSPGIKKNFCAWAKKEGLDKNEDDRFLLRHIRNTAAHDKHFHLMLKCSPHYPGCSNLAELDSDTKYCD
jgi:murein endopeptidase